MLTDSKNRTKHAPIERVVSARALTPQEDWSAQPHQEIAPPEQNTAAPISSHHFDSVGVFAQDTKSSMTLQRDFQEGNAAASSNLGSRIQSQLGAGSPLEANAQATFGNALQHDFSNVRVHADSEADTLSRSVNARAFTTGQDIFFKQGNFNPASSDGQKLLAHELTHIIQQSKETVSGTPMGDVSISDPNDRFEQEASAKAESVSKNELTPVQTARESGAGLQIQRLSDEEKKTNLRSPRLAGNARLQDAFDNNKPVHQGESGDAIVRIQEILIESGIPLPNSTASGAPDGIFGQETRKGVVTYQGQHGLDTDGAVGRQTLGAMDAQTGGGPRVTPTVVAPPTPAGGTITGNPTDIASNLGTNPDGTPKINTLGTTHAAPTINDAVNHTTVAAAGDEARVSHIKIIRDDTSPIETMDAPESDALYRESGASRAGYTPTTGFHGTMAQPLIEEVADNSLYINDAPSPDDVQQYGIGDCYFLALVTSLAARDPNKIKSIMSSDGSGGATILLWQKVQTPSATPGTPPTASYQQVAVQVSDQLAFDRSAASALGTAAANDRQTQNSAANTTTSSGFHIHGAQLRAAPAASEREWWADLNGDSAEVHRRDTFQMARWAPLLEKGFARFTESFGQYGGAHLKDAPKSNPTAGYENINGGWSHDTMVIFYGAAADREGTNEGDAHQTATNWTPGSDVVMSNQAAINDLILLQGRGTGTQAGDTNAPLLTATAMTAQHMPRLKDSINAAKNDPDWANLSTKTKNDCLAIVPLIDAWTAVPNTQAQAAAKATAEQAVGNACVTAADPIANSDLHTITRAKSLKDMLEMLADVRNAGTDHSSGQRNIYGNHVYSVVAVDFLSSTGAPVPLSTTPLAARAALLPTVDAIRSNVTMQNPHHANEPDLENTGPVDGMNDGRFNMTLDQFFRNFTSVEAGLLPITAAP
jgi:peptidoglycan hydrolase-like protein with peptidoglycan-binding domain